MRQATRHEVNQLIVDFVLSALDIFHRALEISPSQFIEEQNFARTHDQNFLRTYWIGINPILSNFISNLLILLRTQPLYDFVLVLLKCSF
jgi:hypothetical protein